MSDLHQTRVRNASKTDTRDVPRRCVDSFEQCSVFTTGTELTQCGVPLKSQIALQALLLNSLASRHVSDRLNDDKKNLTKKATAVF